MNIIGAIIIVGLLAVWRYRASRDPWIESGRWRAIQKAERKAKMKLEAQQGYFN